MESATQYDLIVIGSGPSGQRAAVQAAKLKKRVLVVERAFIGGSCLHPGTIPSKTLREAALGSGADDGDLLREVMDRKESVIRGEEKVIAHQLERNGVNFIEGAASFNSPTEITVANSAQAQVFRGEFIVIATGTHPCRDAQVPFDDIAVFDSDTILTIPRLPKTLAIVGAGIIGCEYASIFAKLGVSVTLVDRRSGLLRTVDEEVVAALENHFLLSGVKVFTGVPAIEIARHTDGAGVPKARLKFGDNESIYDGVLYCIGRNGNSSGLKLENAGIEATPRGLINVNAHYQTVVPHIYAVGDIIGPPALSASSAEQGRLASAHAFLGGEHRFPETFPYGIYTIPEISSVGEQESELKKKGVPYVVGRAYYRELARGKILGDEHGFLKLLVHAGTRKILGVHVIGTGATELVHIGQMAILLGAKVEALVNNVFNYPTLAEAYKVAAYNASNKLSV